MFPLLQLILNNLWNIQEKNSMNMRTTCKMIIIKYNYKIFNFLSILASHLEFYSVVVEANNHGAELIHYNVLDE